MDKNLLNKAKILSRQEYRITISYEKLSDGRVIYMAYNPDLEGCMAQGSTQEEAIKNLEQARIDYIYDALEEGDSDLIFTTETLQSDSLNFGDSQTNIRISTIFNFPDSKALSQEENKIHILQDC